MFLRHWEAHVPLPKHTFPSPTEIITGSFCCNFSNIYIFTSYNIPSNTFYFWTAIATPPCYVKKGHYYRSHDERCQENIGWRLSHRPAPASLEVDQSCLWGSRRGPEQILGDTEHPRVWRLWCEPDTGCPPKIWSMAEDSSTFSVPKPSNGPPPAFRSWLKNTCTGFNWPGVVSARQAENRYGKKISMLFFLFFSLFPLGPYFLFYIWKPSSNIWRYECL